MSEVSMLAAWRILFGAATAWVCKPNGRRGVQDIARAWLCCIIISTSTGTSICSSVLTGSHRLSSLADCLIGDPGL